MVSGMLFQLLVIIFEARSGIAMEANTPEILSIRVFSLLPLFRWLTSISFGDRPEKPG